MAQGQMLYTVTQLGTLGGTNSRATAVNNSGQVVGYSDITGNGSYQAFSYTSGGGMVNLGTPGGAYSRATDINASGQIVGYGSNGAETGNEGFVYAGGTLSVLAGTNNANAINDAGQIAGAAGNTAFLHSAGSLTLLPKHAPQDSTSGTGINNSGTVVGGGQYYDPPGVFSPYSGTQFAVIGGTIYHYRPTGDNSAFDFVRVNDAGRMAGTNAQPGFGATYAAVIGTANASDGGALSYLFNSYVGGSTANDINNGNLVVGSKGYSADFYTPRAYVHDANFGTVQVLGAVADIAAAGFTELNEAMGISDAGHIVGYGKISSGETRGFLLTPIAPFLYFDAGAAAGLNISNADWSTSAAVWAADPAGNNRGNWSNGAIAHFLASGFTSATVTLKDSLTLEGAIVSDNTSIFIAPQAAESLTFTGQAFVDTRGSSSYLELGAEVAGSAGLWKTGGGTLRLTAANTYTGQTLVSAGTVEVTHAQALGATGAGHETVIEDGRVRMAASLTSNESFILRGSAARIGMQSDANRAVMLNGGILLEATGRLEGANSGDNSTLTVNGVISETGGAQNLLVNGATLTGTNTFTGDLVARDEGVTVATLNDANVAGPLGAGPRLVLGYNEEGRLPGNLRYTGATASSNRAIHSEGGGQINIVNAGTSLTLTGAITGNAGFEKAGPGALVITGANTYTGQTTVSAGTLRLANLSGSALGTGNVQVVSGAVLTGPGSFAGSLFLEGEYQVGDPGATSLVSLGGDLSLESGAWIVFSLGGLARGTQYDALDLAGQLYDGAFGTGGIRATFINGFTPTLGDSFNLLDWGSTTLTTLNTDLPVLAGGLAWDTSQLLASGVISVSAIPEPSTYAMLAGLAALALAAWRRRCRSAGS
jgi:autotransporter-associated beta strand protein/probable HAF family extracellular repeat protein